MSNESERRKCTAPRTDGTPCRMPPLAGRAWCWAHDPDNADAAKRARRKGGLAASSGPPSDDVGPIGLPVSLRDVRAVVILLERIAGETLELPNGNTRNRTLATIAQVALRAAELGELEERLNALEERQRAAEQRRLMPWQRNGD